MVQGISNSDSRYNQQTQRRVAYPQQYQQRSQYPEQGQYRQTTPQDRDRYQQYPQRKKTSLYLKKPSLSTVASVVGIAASTAIAYSILKPAVVARRMKNNGAKLFTKMGDDIPDVKGVKDTMSQASLDGLNKLINMADVSEEAKVAAGSPKGANSFLLFGGPGTGKSFFAKVAAKSLDANYTEIDFSKIASPYVGQASKNIRDEADAIINTARKNPDVKHIVTFNEIDALIKVDPQATKNTAEVRSKMLNVLEDMKKEKNIIIIGTTNMNPNAMASNGATLDKASTDRFKTVINVPLPDKKCLKNAIVSKLKKVPGAEDMLKNNEKEIEKFAQDLENEGFSFRKLDQFVDDAQSTFMLEYKKGENEKMTVKHLQSALDAIKKAKVEEIIY
ncbi:MAG: ATP-binding protein [bacterium]|nr:ATP-binding protein [bacterium]